MDELNITAEMPEMPMSKVYIRIDTENRVIALDGGYTTPTDLEGWIEIDEGYGDKYNLCQSHYLDKPLTTMDGIYQYKYEAETVVERSEEEIEEDRQNIPEPPQSDAERLDDVESALVELGEVVGENEVSIQDIADALMELAEIISEV